MRNLILQEKSKIRARFCAPCVFISMAEQWSFRQRRKEKARHRLPPVPTSGGDSMNALALAPRGSRVARGTITERVGEVNEVSLFWNKDLGCLLPGLAARAAWEKFYDGQSWLIAAEVEQYGLQEADALNVAQEVWGDVLRHLSEVEDDDPPQRLRGWLGQVAGGAWREILRDF